MSLTTPSNTPYAQEWLDLEAQTGGRTILTGDVHAIRQQFNTLTAAFSAMLPPPSENVTTNEYKTAAGVTIRVYQPKTGSTGLPTGLYIHSGGWAAGSIDAEDHLIRHLVESVPCVLVSPEYRLAPENPFPAALEDCVSAYRWMASSGADLGSDASRLFIVGGSAGGNLSLTTALKLVDDNDASASLLKGIFALCPATMMPQAAPALPEDLKPYYNPDAYPDAAMINNLVDITCAAAYIGTTSPSHPLISPIFHPKLSKLPFVYTTAANKDPLHDDAHMLRHRLEAEGVEYDLRQYDGYPHFFHILPSLDVSRRFMADLVEGIRGRTG